MSLIMSWYGRGLDAITAGEVDWELDTIKVALLQSTYVPDQGNHQWFSDVSTDEASGSGYILGGAVLPVRVRTYDAALSRIVLSADNMIWESVTVTNVLYAAIYKDTGTAATSPLVGYGQALEAASTTGEAFIIAWDPLGIFRLTVL